MPTNFDPDRLRAIDFFCGAGGMSFGLSEAGISVIAGIDNDATCRRTYESNVIDARFIKHDISTLSSPELLRRLDLKTGDDHLILAGCSPCQFWSKIPADKSKSEETAFLLKQFQKFIRHLRPGFVVVENVPGLANRKGESILPGFLDFLDRQQYAFSDGVVNAGHYGVPQNRMRYLLIANRLGLDIELPEPVAVAPPAVQEFIGQENGFPPILAGDRFESPSLHWASALSEKNLRRIRLSGEPGADRSCWSDSEELQNPAYKGRDEIFRDVYARMYWDRPAPTITTRFNSFSNGRFGHPDEDRAISIREGATLQTFPETYEFHGRNLNQLARQIGNAVPPELARRIGCHLVECVS